MRKTMLRNIHIIIKQSLLNHVDVIFSNHQKIKFKEGFIKKQALFYLLYVMDDVSSFYKNKDTFSLDSQSLIKNFNPKYHLYVDFLIHHQIIILVKDYLEGSHFKTYQFKEPFLKDVSNYVEVSIDDITLLKKINYQNSGKNKQLYDKHQKIKKSRNHLTNGFDANLSIEDKACVKLLKTMNFHKYRANNIALHKFKHRIWEFHTNPLTDDRLHTLLTRLNKQFLKHITYKSQSLAEVDVKTSQPLFLLAIVKQLILNSSSENSILQNLISQKLDKKLIGQIVGLNSSLDEIEQLEDIIVHQDLYEYIGKHIAIKQEGDLFLRYEFDKATKSTRLVKYNSKRTLVKQLLMETLYSSHHHKNKEVKQVKTLFSNLFSIVDLIKSSSLEKNFFPCLLQQIEANILLDVIAKNIFLENPKAVLFSKHDSLISTLEHIHGIKAFMEKQLSEILNIPNISLKIEYWQ